MSVAREVTLILIVAAVAALTTGSIWITIAAWATFQGIERGIALLLLALNGPVFAAVGALISWRRPGNRVGLLALLGGLTIAGSSLGTSTRRYAEATGDPDALPLVISRISDIGWLAAVTVLALGLQLFPTGRSLSPRWRVLAIATIAWAAGMSFVVMFARYTFSGSLITGLNPTAIPGVVGDALAAFVLAVPVFPFLAALTTLSLLSLVIRFRRASEVERAQLKWFVAMSLFGGGLLALGPVTGSWGSVIANVGILGIPISIGIAVLRYRLYDIDLLINRTLVYGAVTATLIATYAATVLLLRQLFGTFTVGNDVAIAASTLLIAALFQPVRRRIQDTVDSRFYRQKYDAAKTVAAFSARLRQEIDLDSVIRDLTRVARTAVRPAHSSVWLRRGQEPR